jgi:hypothetical protein
MGDGRKCQHKISEIVTTFPTLSTILLPLLVIRNGNTETTNSMVAHGPWQIAAICISILIGQCHSLTPYPLQVGGRTPSLGWTDHRATSWSLTARRRNRPNSDDDDDKATTARGGDRGGGEIPQLPAIGASSFHSRPSVTSSSSTTFDATNNKNNNNSNTAFVGSNFQLQYTCKVCETRNCHIVSRIGRYT